MDAANPGFLTVEATAWSALRTSGVAVARMAVVVGCLVSPAVPFAMTLAEPEPDPWFSVWVQVKAESLPRGVKFKLVSFATEDQGYFANSTSTPFYLVTQPSTPPTWVDDLPPTFIPDRMAVSGAAYRMEMTRSWARETLPGIEVVRFLRVFGDHPIATIEMDAYLGGRKIAIRGRYLRGSKNEAELDSALPEPLRLARVPARGGRFVIVNDGPVPLYTGTAFAKPVGWVREVPPGFLAVYKLVSGKAYYGELSHPSTADGWNEAQTIDARLTERDLETYLPGFKFKQVFRDNRPRNVKVPGPQPFAMTAFYGSKKITVRGRILYGLNPNYDPLAGQREPSCVSCTGKVMCDECAKIQSRRGPIKKPPRRPPTY